MGFEQPHFLNFSSRVSNVHALTGGERTSGESCYAHTAAAACPPDLSFSSSDEKKASFCEEGCLLSPSTEACSTVRAFSSRNLSTRAFPLDGALNEALSLLLQGPLSTVPNDLRAPKRSDHLLVKPLLSRWPGGTTALATRQQQPEGPQPATAGGGAPSPRPIPFPSPLPRPGEGKASSRSPEGPTPGSARLGRADPSTRTRCGLRAEPLRARRRRRPPFEEPPLPARGLPPPLSPGGWPPALRLTLAMLLR